MKDEKIRNKKGRFIKGHKPLPGSEKSYFKQGNIPWNKGKHPEQMGGENHWNWQGGISDIPDFIRTSYKYREWRKKVLKRDDYTCQVTGKRDGLEVHHVKNYKYNPELRFNVDNGITLSRQIHILFHRLYTKYSNSLEQIERFKRYLRTDCNSIKITNWDELIKLIKNTNPYVYTIIMDGWVDAINDKGKRTIKALYIKKIPVEILKKDYPK